MDFHGFSVSKRETEAFFDMRQSGDGARSPASEASRDVARSFLNDSEHQVVALAQLVLEKHPERPLFIFLSSHFG